MKSSLPQSAGIALLGLWLSACTPTATTHPSRPDQPPAESAARPALMEPPGTLAPVKVTADRIPEPVATDLWQDLRNSFVMDDCGGEQRQDVDHWAHLFTESPNRFEANLRRALPSLRYIQQIASQRGMPGEFVLLPWVESHYLPVFSRRNRPVGMWQIMPDTARTMGLQVGHHYDARLDTAATTEAIFDLIAGYYQQYHDWRLADYAFNSGTGTINRLLARHGPASAQESIPSLPVHRGTREHLVKLMAIACVIRHPEAYGVELPHLAPSQRLEPVVIPKAMPVAEAAAKAGLPEETLTQLNSAFLDGTIDPSRSETLLLPRANVQRWYDTDPSMQSWPSSGTEDHAAERAAPASPDTRHALRKRHCTVKRGDTLSGIAHRHHVSTQQLIRWNHLGKRPLKPGQILRLEPR